MSKKNKTVRGEIGPDHPFFNRLKGMIDTCSDNEKSEEKVNKFFEWYEEVFKIAILGFNNTCGEAQELIDDFEEEIESKRKATGEQGASIKDSDLKDFGMSLISLKEKYQSHMRIAAPFINMAFRYSFEDNNIPKFFQDIGTVLEGTNERVLYWEEKLMKTLGDK